MNFGAAQFNTPPPTTQHLSDSSALLFDFHIPPLRLAEIEESGGSGGSLKVREAGL